MQSAGSKCVHHAIPAHSAVPHALQLLPPLALLLLSPSAPLSPLPQEVAALRQQLEEATREKVAALMRVADMQGSSRAGSPGRTDSANGDAGKPGKSPAKQQAAAASPAKQRAGGWWGSPARAH